MNICFVSNFTKTIIFDKVAKRLIEEGFGVFWVVVNHKYKEFLLKDYEEKNVLYLNKEFSNKKNEAQGNYKINELVINDRFLSKDVALGQEFLKNIQNPIYNFISSNSITSIFGELTWAHEILISRIARNNTSLNCRYYNPHVVRIPNNRFAFFENEKEDIELKDDSLSDIDAPLIKLEKPDYLKVNDEIVRKSISFRQRFKRLKRFISAENVEKNDPSLLYKFDQRLKRGVKEELNKIRYRGIKKVGRDEIIEKKFILYTLHKQPEASIDVVGRYYNDQSVLIRNICQILPDNWFLVVKEHSNAIGDRNPKFYEDIWKLPRTILVDEKCDSYDLIDHCQAVFTVSGTIAYEAAILKKISFTFAPMFFNKLQFCHRITLEDFRDHSSFIELEEMKNTQNKEKMDLQAFSNFLYANTYEGSWNPALETSLSPDNINLLSKAVLSLLSDQ